MKLKKLTALLLGVVMTASLLAGCGAKTEAPATEAATTTEETAEAPADETAEAPAEEAAKEYSEDEIVDFDMFIAMPGSEKNDGNEIKEIIAKKTGFIGRVSTA